jgi:hypothetical protein
MNRTICAAGALSLLAGAAGAAGLDRSNQSVSALFNDPGSAALSLGWVEPSVTGDDDLGNSYDVGVGFSQTALSWTQDISDAFS